MKVRTRKPKPERSAGPNRARMALGLVALVGCANRGSFRTPPPWIVDLGAHNHSGQPTAAVDGGHAPHRPKNFCADEVILSSLSPSGASCFLDAPAQGERGLLAYECAGGEAQLTFGERVFSGTFRNEAFLLQAESRYPWQNCTWATQQKITGSRSALYYTYAEHPEEPLSACQGTPCDAHGLVMVEPRDGEHDRSP